MKKALFLLIIFLFCSILGGCAESADLIVNVPSEGLEGAPEVKIDPASNEEEPPATVPDPVFWLMNGGETVIPYVTFAYGQSYYEDENGSSGFIQADGVGFFGNITEFTEYMPHITKEFDPIFGENAELRQINVYSLDGSERVAFNISLDELRTILENTPDDLIVEMQVYCRGKYIESADEYEYSVYSCAFIVDYRFYPGNCPGEPLETPPPGASETELPPCLGTNTPTQQPDPASTEPPVSGTVRPTAEPIEQPTPAPTAAPAPTERPFILQDDDFEGFLYVRHPGEKTVEPYEHFEWSTSFVEEAGGFLHGDGFSFYELLHHSDLIDNIPEVGASRGLCLILGRDCRISQISVFDAVTLDRLENSITKAQLRTLLDSTDARLIICVNVIKQGRYIEQADEYEQTCIRCAFIVN